MSAPKIQNMVFVTEYQAKNNETKKRYQTIGRIVTFPKGAPKVEIDLMPTNWAAGECVLFDKDAKSPS